MKSRLFAIAALAAIWTSPVHAAQVTAQNPQSIVNALQDAGYQAKLGTDKEGDPMITSGANGSSFQIFFYNCTNHKDCATVQFYSGYKRAGAVSLSQLNEWNQSQRFARAYLDSVNDPVITMDVDLDDGGVSALLFIDNIEFWTALLSRFEKLIGYRQ